jgi:hypothetical protein
LLNDVQFVEAARALADQVIQAKQSDADSLKVMFRKLAGRFPDSREFEILERSLKEQRMEFAKAPADAEKLLKVGDSKPKSADKLELAAWTVVAQLVINSDSVVWSR